MTDTKIYLQNKGQINQDHTKFIYFPHEND